MIAIKQYPNSIIQPADDGALYNFFAGGKSGIFEGCTVTNPIGTSLMVADGAGLLSGRMFKVTSETISASVPPTEQNGRLLIEIDLNNYDSPIHFVTQFGSFPALVQEDLNNGGTIYQFPLATYRISSGGISNLVNVAPRIKVGSSNWVLNGSLAGGAGYWSSDNASWAFGTGSWNWVVIGNDSTIQAKVYLTATIANNGSNSDDYDIIDLQAFFNNEIKPVIEAYLGESISPTVMWCSYTNALKTSDNVYATRPASIYHDMDWSNMTLGGVATVSGTAHEEEAIFDLILTR